MYFTAVLSLVALLWYCMLYEGPYWMLFATIGGFAADVICGRITFGMYCSALARGGGICWGAPPPNAGICGDCPGGPLKKAASPDICICPDGNLPAQGPVGICISVGRIDGDGGNAMPGMEDCMGIWRAADGGGQAPCPTLGIEPSACLQGPPTSAPPATHPPRSGMDPSAAFVGKPPEGPPGKDIGTPPPGLIVEATGWSPDIPKLPLLKVPGGAL